MSILYFMIPFALLMGAIFVGGFLWMVSLDQYDDLDTPAVRILFAESGADCRAGEQQDKGSQSKSSKSNSLNVSNEPVSKDRNDEPKDSSV